MKIERESFHKWLKREMKTRHLDYATTANKVGVSTNAFSSWVYGRAMPSTFNMECLLSVLGWHIELNGETIECHEVPNKLNAIRIKREIKHADLEQMANIKHQTLSWCCQTEGFKFDTMYKICDVLGATLELVKD